MNTLSRLHADIDAENKPSATNIQTGSAALGCDGCCKRLAERSRLTAAEWDLLRDGLAALPPEQLLEISMGIAALAEQTSRPFTCPMLDNRGVAGFTPIGLWLAAPTVLCPARDKGLYCKESNRAWQRATGLLVVW